VDRPGDHAVGNSPVDHHGPEGAHIGHGIQGHLPRNALVFSELEIGLSEILPQFRGGGVDDGHIAQGQAEDGDLFRNLGRVSQQREIDDIPQVHDFRGPQDPFLGALRKNDVAALRPGPADEVVLEHERGDAGGSQDVDPMGQSGHIYMGFENAEGSGNLPLVLGGDSRVNGVDRSCGHKGVGLDMEDGDRGTFQSFEETVHLRDGLEGAGEDEAGNPGIGGRFIGNERGDQDIGAVAGRDHQTALFQVVQEIGQFHGGHLEVKHLPVEPLRVAVQHFGLESPLDFTHGRPVEERVCRQDKYRSLRGWVLLKSRNGVGHDLWCDPIDDHPENIAPLFCQEFRHEPHRFDDLRHVPGLPGDHGQERSAKVARHFHIEFKL